MSPSPAASDSDQLDQMTNLPRQSWVSFVLVLVVQSLNAFNDNFVKMLLISLAITVAAGTALGDNIELYLGAIFSVPYILFAPVAGWCSDRMSKKRVLAWMQVAQLGCFAFFAWTLSLKHVPLSLELSLLGFFFLATQAAFLSPAKMGVMKELVGSRRLGLASGWLQMTMMAGILAGMWAGGTWYGAHLESTKDAWMSALWPLLIIGGLAVGELVASIFVQRTPEHPEVPFRASLFWEHFTHLGLVLRHKPIRLAGLGVTYFWFVSNALSFILVTLSKELHPDAAQGSGPLELARVAAILGVGVITGSMIASTVCRRRIQLGLVPLGGFGLMAGMLWAGLAPVGSIGMYAGLVFTGAAGGCFMVPLYAFVQDRAAPEERARIISAINLMDCLATFLAVGVISVLKAAGLSASWQFIALALPTFFAAAYVTRLVPGDLLRLIALGVVRVIYQVKAVNHLRVPREGGVLLLANHVSYVDALIIGAACERPVRFVMWDVLYNIKVMTWFLRIVGTVPISSTRAKDAIRSVAAALKEGQIVCLFPEGQITRHGMINELRKGFELMARQGDARVVPVYLDGLYGSIFSYEGGVCFRKWPKKLRYPVSVLFGHPLPAREATPQIVRRQMQDLSAEALQSRKELSKINGDASRQTTTANALRLLEIEWARAGETLLCLAPVGDAIHQTLTAYAAMRPRVHLTLSMDSVAACVGSSVIAIGRAVDMHKIAGLAEWARVGLFVMCWDEVMNTKPADIPAYRGLLDGETLIATCVPDPAMPAGEEGNQLGTREHSFGRLLPGVEISHELAQRLDRLRLHLTEDGFLMKNETAPPLIDETAP